MLDRSAHRDVEPHLNDALTARIAAIEVNQQKALKEQAALRAEQASIIEEQDDLIEELQDILKRHMWTNRGLCIECSERNPRHHPDCGLDRAMRT